MKYWSFIILAILCLTSCTSKQNIATSTPDIKGIIADSETILVDVRIKEQFNEKTAPNSVNIPLAEIENNLEFLRGQKNIVVFCNSGRQADEAIKTLHKKGIHNVYDGTTWKNVRAIQDENEKK